MSVSVLVALLTALLVATTHCHEFIHPLSNLKIAATVQQLDDNISIEAAPTVLQTSGSFVQVTWSGVSKPSKHDWIGVYAPREADYTKKAPIKYQYAHASSTHMSHGFGSLRFHMVNMRTDIGFVFFRHGIHHPAVASVSNRVIFQNPNEPLQIHLALTHNPRTISVSWVSGAVSNPQVKWGELSEKYSHWSKAVWSTYSASDLCGEPAATLGWREPGWLIAANITNLLPDTFYYYIVGDDKYGWSKELSFVSPKLPNSSVTTKVVAFGDMGNGMVDESLQHWEQQPSLKTTKLISQRISETDIVLHIGDMSYAVGYAAEWDEFFDQISPIASHVPYMVCIGNHERDFPHSNGYFDGTDSGGECGVPHERRFLMPRPRPDEPWYGVKYGNIHFIFMSTEHDWRPGSAQAVFLERELASVNRSQTPWVVFSGHRPMYVDSTDAFGRGSDTVVSKSLRQHVEHLLQLYGVDLALWGHHHSYQRSCPVYNETCTASGTTHVVIGMAGQSLSHTFRPIKPVWAVYLDDKHHGYSRFEANGTHLTFTYIRNDDNDVHDQFTLVK
ncbi:uncharacterized protein LOC134179856 [Corticium candelabrum]|uniref:uncharacterized protein LOC134179856 n=1 Tax=Corticium candelabrum TaxID=121492 RepID=UPI002E2770C3|nr:uncharacterized protein LOC134179856 [Corticium candelabrum]